MIRYILLVLIGLIPTLTFGGSPEKILYTCEQNICKVYVLTNAQNKVMIFSRVPEDEKWRVGYKKYSENLVGVIYSCGSPCSSTTFVNLNTGKKSGPFDLVIAVDPKRNLVAYPGAADNTLEIADIFSDRKKIKIKRNFAPTAVLNNVVAVNFLSNNQVKLDYSEGENFVNKSEVINLHPSDFSIKKEEQA